MPLDVFEEDEFEVWPEFSGDPLDVGEKVSLVALAFSLSGVAEWLAWVSGDEGVDGPCEWSSVEGGDVVPDRGGREVSGALGGDEGLAGVFLDLDKASGVVAGLGQHEAHIEATAA